MKKLILVISAISLILLSCRNSTTNKNDNSNTQSASENNQMPKSSKKYKSSSGKLFIISEDHSLGYSISKVKIETKGFTEHNSVYDLGELEPIENVFFADLDQNGYEEIYFTTRSAGSGSYSNIYGFASNNDKSVSPIYVSEITKDDLEIGGLFEGYAGHNKFELESEHIINSFSIYKEGDNNSSPSGGQRCVYYSLIAGEAGWILTPVKTQSQSTKKD